MKYNHRMMSCIIFPVPLYTRTQELILLILVFSLILSFPYKIMQEYKAQYIYPYLFTIAH